jgi:hypothetical protein
MDRGNHYEAAFESYLRERRLCYVAVDESRRALLGDSTVKSLDFIVHGGEGARLLVDVKGRRFPGGPDQKRRIWECWAEQDDVSGLLRWEELFGPGYQGLLVFTYHILPCVELPEDTEDLWTWRGRRYLLRAVAVGDYRRHMRVRSPRWKTYDLPGKVFRALVRPFHHFSDEIAYVPEVETEECPF